MRLAGVYPCHPPTNWLDQDHDNNDENNQLVPVRQPHAKGEGFRIRQGRGMPGCSNAAGTQVIERQVQGEDVDVRLPEDPELAGFDLLRDQRTDVLFAQVPLPGNAGDLVFSSCDADIRVQPASRCGDQVDRDQLRLCRIRCMQGIGPGFYRISERRIIRPEIGS